MQTKEFLKLLVISAGYPKNVSVEAEKVGFGDYIYFCYGETIDYTDEDDEADIDANIEENILDIEGFGLYYTICSIIEKAKPLGLSWLDLSKLETKYILDDEFRVKYLLNEKKDREEREEWLKKMQPVDKYIDSINPCNLAPNCVGNFDDSDTCSGFWKCTHQYHSDCPVRKEYSKTASRLSTAYGKYVNNEHLTSEEMAILTEHKLI